MNTHNQQKEIPKHTFKKIVLIGSMLIIATTLFAFTGLLSLFFYIHSSHFSQLLQNQINKNISGKMEWRQLDFALDEGELTLYNYKLSLNGDEILSLDRIHIAIELSNILKPFEFLTSDIRLSLANIIGNNLIVKDIVIEKPRLKLAMTPEQELNIVSAFEVLENHKETNDIDRQFNLPFNLIINNLTLRQGIFIYSFKERFNKQQAGADSDQHQAGVDLDKNQARFDFDKHQVEADSGEHQVKADFDKHQVKTNNHNSQAVKLESEFNDVLIDNINLKCDAIFTDNKIDKEKEKIDKNKIGKDKSDIKLHLSMQSSAGDLLIKGGVSISDLREPDKTSVFDLTTDLNIISHELISMLESFGIKINRQLISGKIAIHTALSGNLNDPSIACNIDFPDGKIMGINIKKGVFDAAMKEREISIKNFKLEHYFPLEKNSKQEHSSGISQHQQHAKLNSYGKISIAKIFPKGFIGNGDRKNNINNEIDLGKIDLDEILDELNCNLTIAGENINLARIFEFYGAAIPQTIKEPKNIEEPNTIKNSEKIKMVGEIKEPNNAIKTQDSKAIANIKEIKGKYSFKAEISGTPKSPEIAFTLKAQDAGYKDFPVINSANIDLTLAKGVVNIKELDLSSCDSSIEIDGSIKLLEQQKDGKFQLMADPQFDLSANSKKINLTDYLKCLNIDEKENKLQNNNVILYGNSQLTGSASNPKLEVDLNGKDIELMGQKIGAASLKAIYHNDKTTFNSIVIDLSPNNKMFVDNKFNSNERVEFSSKNNFQYDKILQSNNNFQTKNIIEARGFIEQNGNIKADIFSEGVDLSLIESVKQSNAIKGFASGSVTIEGSLKSIESSKVNGDIALKQVKIMDKQFQDFNTKFVMKNKNLNLSGRLNFDLNADLNLNSKDFSVQGVFNNTDLTPWIAFAGVKTIEKGLVSGTINIKGNTDKIATVDNISGECDLSKLDLLFYSDSDALREKMWVKANNIKAWSNGKEFNLVQLNAMLPENGKAMVSASGKIGGNIKATAEAVLPAKFASLFVQDMADTKGSLKINLKADIKPEADIKSSVVDTNIELVNIGVTLPISATGDSSESSYGNHSEVIGSLNLYNINGTIKADTNKIEIVQITGRVSNSKNSRKVTNIDTANLDNKHLDTLNIGGKNTDNKNLDNKNLDSENLDDDKKSLNEKMYNHNKVALKSAGQFTLNGGIKLINLEPKNIDAQLTAKAIPVNLVDDLEANFDAALNYKGDLSTSSLLSGNIVINHAQWSRDIHVEKHIFSTLTDMLIEKKKVRKEVKQKNKQITERDSSNIASDTEQNKIIENMKLNINIKGKKPFIVDNNLAYLEIHPDIKIRGAALSPVISGRSEINPGTINYQSTEFTITRGIIDFVNPYQIEPELDIESNRKIRDWNITLAVTGSPDNINFKLTSDPTLEDGDIISLLLRGKTVTELINAEGGTTLSAASMLSQIAASAVSDRVKSATGLDIFEVGFGNNNSSNSGSKDKSNSRIGKSISSSKSNNTDDKDDNGLDNINVTVGKELTDRITVKYGTENKDGVMVSTTSAQYKITDNVSVSGFQDSAGQFGGEVRYRLEFR